jgi:hypothetical protein
MQNLHDLLSSKDIKKDSPISLKVTASLKNDLELISKHYDVSLNECINIILSYQIEILKDTTNINFKDQKTINIKKF